MVNITFFFQVNQIVKNTALGTLLLEDFYDKACEINYSLIFLKLFYFQEAGDAEKWAHTLLSSKRRILAD